MSEETPTFTDHDLFIAQELWALVEQARQRGTWFVEEEKP